MAPSIEELEQQALKIKTEEQNVYQKIAHEYMLEAIDHDDVKYVQDALRYCKDILSQKGYTINKDEKISYLEAAILNNATRTSDYIISAFKEKGALTAQEKDFCIKALKTLETTEPTDWIDENITIKQIQDLSNLNYGEEPSFVVRKYKLLRHLIFKDIYNKQHING